VAEYVVDTDGTTGDYASLEAACNGIGSLSEDTDIILQASTGAGDDVTADIDITLNGYELNIYPADGDEAVKTGIDSSRYRRTASMTVSVACTIRGMQIDVAGTLNGMSIAATSGVVIDSCYIQSDGNGNNHYGILDATWGSITDCEVRNTIIRGFDAHAINGNSTMEVYHCILEGNGDQGIFGGSGSDYTITNTASFNNTGGDFDCRGTSAIDHCASDDGDGTNAVAASGSDWDNEYEDPDNGDMTPVGGNTADGGTSGTGVTTDMEGTAYDDTSPSIGAIQYVAAGGTTMAAQHYRRMLAVAGR